MDNVYRFNHCWLSGNGCGLNSEAVERLNMLNRTEYKKTFLYAHRRLGKAMRNTGKEIMKAITSFKLKGKTK